MSHDGDHGKAEVDDHNPRGVKDHLKDSLPELRNKLEGTRLYDIKAYVVLPTHSIKDI